MVDSSFGKQSDLNASCSKNCGVQSRRNVAVEVELQGDKSFVKVRPKKSGRLGADLGRAVSRQDQMTSFQFWGCMQF